MKRLGLGVAALTAIGIAAAVLGDLTPVRAADLPVARAQSYSPAYVPRALYNWTGFYFGGNVGVGLLADSASPVGIPGSVSIGPVGVVGGGQVGADYQFGTWVVGLEGKADASNISGNGTAINAAVPGLERYTSAPHWIAAATGRVGYANNDMLFYVKGGGAWMNVTYTDDFLAGGATIDSQNFKDTRSGFTAGVGLEFGLIEHVSARVEYDFYDFGSKTYNFTNFANLVPASIKSNLHVLEFGLNYRFGSPGGGPPVVAAKD